MEEMGVEPQREPLGWRPLPRRRTARFRSWVCFPPKGRARISPPPPPPPLEVIVRREQDEDSSDTSNGGPCGEAPCQDRDGGARGITGALREALAAMESSDGLEVHGETVAGGPENMDGSSGGNGADKRVPTRGGGGYSWIAHQLELGTSLRRRHNLVQFQVLDHFWIPQPKLHGAMYLIFFVKPQNGDFAFFF